MSDVVEQARELLAGITPGQWSIQKNRHPEFSGQPWGWIEGPRAHYTWSDDKPGTRADAEFIAAAPQLVKELADEVASNRFTEASLIVELRDEVERLVNALRCETPRRLRALGRELVEHGDATPHARSALFRIADEIAGMGADDA